MNVEKFSLQLLDLNSTQQIDQYEKLFYSCFISIENQTLIRKIWVFDDANKRLRTKISYANQEIYTIHFNQNIIAALAINLNESSYQFEEFGFRSLPKTNNQQKSCEILALFSIQPVVTKSRWRQVCERLKNYSITDALTTTSESVLPLYLRLGFSVLEYKVVQEQERYFLYFDIQHFLERGECTNEPN